MMVKRLAARMAGHGGGGDQAGQHADDDDHDEHFDQREAPGAPECLGVGIHGGWFLLAAGGRFVGLVCPCERYRFFECGDESDRHCQSLLGQVLDQADQRQEQGDDDEADHAAEA